MNKLRLKTLKAIRVGQIVSGVGMAAYFVCCALALPEIVIAAVSGVFALAALWTLFSLLLYAEEHEADISYNTIWGQTALVVLLGVCCYLTVRGILRG